MADGGLFDFFSSAGGPQDSSPPPLPQKHPQTQATYSTFRQADRGRARTDCKPGRSAAAATLIGPSSFPLLSRAEPA